MLERGASLADGKALITKAAEFTRQLPQHVAGLVRRVSQLLGGRRPAATLLCVIANRFVRADMDAEGRLLAEPEWLPIQCDSIADLSLAVTTALAGERAVGRRLWLLHDGLPNHTVTVPTGQVAGLEGLQLSQALLFELEQMTGNPLPNRQAAHALISLEDGQSLYWLTHVPKTLIAQLQRAAKQQGCQFAGLLHPGGLPRPLSVEAVQGKWARLEIWPDVLIGLDGGKQGKPNAWVIQAGTKARRIQGEVERWRAELGEGVVWETLGEGAVLDFMPADAKAIQWEDGEILVRWLNGWGTSLKQGLAAPIPLIEPPEDASLEPRWMAVYAVAAVAVCLLHWGWETRRVHEMEKELGFYRGNESRVMSLDVEVGRYRKQRDDLKRQMEPALGGGRAAQMPEVLAALKQRYASLLREVSISSTDGMVIEQILTKPEGVLVKGVSLDAAEANVLASALDGRLRGLGWRVEPARKKDLAYDVAGGPWEFEILLSDIGLAGFTIPQATTGGRQ